MKTSNYTFIFILLFLVTSVPTYAQNDFVSGAIYLKVKTAAYKGTLGDKSVNIAYELPFLTSVSNAITYKAKPFNYSKTQDVRSIYRLEFDKNVSIDSLINVLKSNPSIEYVEKIRKRTVISTPNDTQVGSQWHLTKINAFTAWDIVVPSGQAIVAVVDNAIQTNHVDLAANMVAGYDVADLDNDPSPPSTSFDHGTHVAGIVSAITNNSAGIAAAANNRVKIMPIKATPNAGDSRSIYNGYEGIQWAIEHGASIISLSWGGSGYSQAEQDVITSAYTNGIIVIAAAGNANSEVLNYPAAYNHVISVASTDSDDKKSSFSSYGETVDISAPGRGILSTIPFDLYASFNGTSMATPLVASVCGYLKSAYPSLTPDAIESLLKNTADNIETLNPTYEGKLGAGRINMQKMVGCRNVNLSNIQITAATSTYICSDETTNLQITPISNATYQWFKNDVSISGANASQYLATSEGSYKLAVQVADCAVFSNTINVIENKLKTPPPTVNEIEAFYCEQINAGAGLIATAANCTYGGPSTATYTGPTVGYDGFERSGDHPTVQFSTVGGTVTAISVSVTWAKKDAYTYYSCADADGGAVPYNEEVSFDLISPSGKKISLVAAGTYARGTTSSGMVTTTFSISGAVIPTGALPQSGTFKPQGDFGLLVGEIPNGTWTLIGNDDGLIDPLCVSGFSVTLTTNATNGSPSISWFSSANSTAPIGTGNEYLPQTTTIGKTDFFVQSQCQGLCKSDKIKTSLFVKPVPYIVAFKLNSIYPSITEEEIKDLKITQVFSDINGINVQIEKITNGITTTNTVTVAPLTSPITFCQPGMYVAVATGCNGTVVWNNGITGEGDIVYIANNYQLSATCNQTWNCTALGASTIQFLNGNQTTNLVLSERTLVNANQAMSAESIQSTQKINGSAMINFNATKKIELLPGFETKNNPIFKAEISGCKE